MLKKSRSSESKIYTIGHSTRPIQELIALLEANGIQRVIDIRSIPRSRYNPQFDQDALKASLKRAKIGYRHMKALGGLRHPKKSSMNIGWRNASFRGYADYMQTVAFQKALLKLEKIAQESRCALLCAEAVPWRCHRSLVADALKIKKWKVFHIVSTKRATLHHLTPFLQIIKGKMVYL